MMLRQLRVKVIVNTDDLLKWAARHRRQGHASAAEALTVAAEHYANITADRTRRGDPPAPTYPRGSTKELRHWANWHVDHHTPAGVANVLFEAVNANAAARRARKGAGA